MYLVLDGTQVHATLDTPRRGVHVVGEAMRAAGGGHRSTVRSRARTWTVQTVPLAPATAAALRTLLDGTQRSATGSFAGGATVQVACAIEAAETVRAAGGLLERISFVMWEVLS